MTWLGNNWIWIVFAFGMFAMHFFGHRHGHGPAHGNGHDHDPAAPADRLGRQTEGEVFEASGPLADHPHAPRGNDANTARRSSIVPKVAPEHETASVDASAPTTEHAAHGGEERPTGDRRHRNHC